MLHLTHRINITNFYEFIRLTKKIVENTVLRQVQIVWLGYQYFARLRAELLSR